MITGVLNHILTISYKYVIQKTEKSQTNGISNSWKKLLVEWPSYMAMEFCTENRKAN